MLEKDLIRDIKNRLHTINGQLNGILKMLDNDKDPEQILLQFKAATKALDSAQFLLLDETFRKSLAIKIAQAMEACPGNCGQEEKIELLRKQFPQLEPEELTRNMKEIQTAYDNIIKEEKNE